MGSNVDCRPSLLVSFAALGTAFARAYLGIENPRVGLLSVGTEATKGNRQVQESNQLLQESHLNFVGNVEGMDVFTDRADVIVCDGFVGNILMKFTEGLGTALAGYLQKQLSRYLSPQDIKQIAAQLWETTNLPRKMGGPLFGVNGVVVVGHGSSRAEGVAGAIDTALQCVQRGLVESMRQELARMHQKLDGAKV
jgi:glycerol-3-phosphate acyltransferase PlsX